MTNPTNFLKPEHRKIVERFTSFPPTQVESLADRLGAHIWEGEQKTSLHFDGSYGYIIVREDMPYIRKRYFKAKGLAMLMLLDRPYVSDQVYIDIATEIIMPERLIREYCALNRCDPKYHPIIAETFKVTLPALKLRLSQLGLVSEEENEPA